MVSSRGLRLDDPTISTAQQKTSGATPPPPPARAPAVGAAVDRDLGPVGPALADDVVDRVDQVVVQLGAPLAVAGVDEVLAVAGGAAVVDLDAEVAAVGQPLRLG